MLSLTLYKLVHFLGITLLLISLGALIVHQGAGLSKRALAMTHGVGLFLILVSGFGMLARLGIHGFPVWVILKLALWLLFGAMMAIIPRRRARQAKGLWILVISLAFVAAYIALYKPGI